ncbi:transcriptional regulator [Acrocarpospora phusangensis]|uniref:Transcriptional regulator n=1 Tax=Acrocarpospora phusangensis TaxID=1070424 RepID=A0A919ULN9_9ACTN|nr:DUF397 domain-containing protein [Acrocarpospora phusangensis]GIH22473.1 transcriptional regulator [Acrocarpospora phusangensis]
MNTHGVDWKKSSWSINGNCVEVARLGNGSVGVRDSKDQEGPALFFTADEWTAFVKGVKGAEFDF